MMLPSFVAEILINRGRKRHIREIRKALDAAGWKIHEFASPNFSLLVVKVIPGSPNLVAAISTDMPELTQFKRNIEQSYYRYTTAEHNCVGVFILAREPAASLKEVALRGNLILITADEIGALEQIIDDFKLLSGDRIAAIKHNIFRSESIVEHRSYKPSWDHVIDSMSLIYESKYTICLSSEKKNTTLLVFFSDEQHRTENVPSVFYWNDADTLLIYPRTSNWYPAHDAEVWIDVLLSYIERNYAEDRVFGLGLLQGGYGVLKYSAKLKIRSSIAIPGIFSADPIDIKNSWYSETFSGEINYNMRVCKEDLPEELLIVYDPYDPSDAEQASQIASMQHVAELLIPFAGRSTCELALDGVSLSNIVSGFFLKDRKSLSLAASLMRSRIANRPFNMALCLVDRKPHTSLKLFKKYGLSNVKAWAAVCYLLSRAGFTDEVIEPVVVAADADLCDLELQAIAAMVALDAYDHSIALRCISRAFNSEPSNQKYIWIRQNALDLATKPPQLRKI